MEHPYIDDEHVVDRYLAGDLPENELVRFEEHLFECEDCLEAVEWGDELRRGVRDVSTDVDSVATRAEVDTLPPSPPGFTPWLSSAAGRSVFVAMTLGVLALGAAVLWQQTELSRLRDAETGARSVAGELAEPIADFQVASVGVIRGGSATEIRLDPARSAVLLSLELPEVDEARYRVTLFDDDGQIVWRGENLEPSLYDTLMVALPSSFLAPGEYRIAIAAGPGGEPIGEMTLRVAD